MAEKVEFYRETEFKDTEIGRIPKEWEVVNLGSIAKISSGNTAPQEEKYFKNGKYPFIRVQHLKELQEEKFPVNYDFVNDYALSELKLKLFKKGCIVFPKSGESIKLEKRAMLKEDSCVVNHLAVIEPLYENIDNLFLFYYLCTIKTSNYLTETTMPSLNLSTISNFLVPLPSLIEQQRIAEILSTVDKAIQKTDDIIAKTERLKRGMMRELLTKGIGRKEFKDTEIGRIPKEWEVKKLDEIADPQRGLSYSGEEKSNTETADGYLFLTLNSIKEGGGLKEDGWTWIKSDRIKEMHFVREGDIVIANTEQSKDGSLIGSPAIVHFPEWYKKDKAVYSMDLSKLNFKTKILDAQFIFFYLSFVQSIAKVYHTGTNVWHLKVDSWAKDLDVIIPPLSEQQQIASILLAIDERLDVLRKERVKLERIKSGFMSDLLSGRIRVGPK